MARDLILGRTRRDWSCGGPLELLRALQAADRLERRMPFGTARVLTDLQRAEEAQALGEATERKVRNTRDLVALLTQKGGLPTSEREPFAPTARKWEKFKSRRRGKYLPEDYVTLLNFQKACQNELGRISSRVRADAEARRKKTKTTPPENETPGAPRRPSVTGLVVATALGFAGTLLLNSRKET